jgi:benzoyl-CoA reductase/2-hydroxyglutaryl-CoA dehydratase subunit BcrC/BadD/HgdB
MSSERVPIKTVDNLHQLMFRHYMEAKSAGGEGKKVAWVTSGSPVELLHAAGILPVYPENHAALCGAQKRGVEFCSAAEEKGFSRDLCSYARTDLGCIYSADSPVAGLPKPDMLLCCNNICGTVTKWYEELQRHFDVPLVYIDTPFLHDGLGDHALDYVAAQMKEAAAVIGDVAGSPIDRADLCATVARSTRAGDLWRDILDLCTNRPSPMTSFDTFVHIAPIVTMRGTDACIEYYEELLAEMKERVDKGIAAVSGERYRLGWDNIPIWFKLGALSKRFASHKACLAAATYTDAWTTMRVKDNNPETIMRDLARSYTSVYINCGLEERLRVVLDMVEKYSLDGVVLHSNRSCKSYSLGQYDIARILKEEHNVPTVVIEGDMNDSRSYADEQVHARIDAFIETLDARAESC